MAGMVYRSSTLDCNVEEQGIYRVSSSASNFPSVSDTSMFQYGGVLINFTCGGPHYVVQLLVPFGHSKLFLRPRVDSWRSWVEVV